MWHGWTIQGKAIWFWILTDMHIGIRYDHQIGTFVVVETIIGDGGTSVSLEKLLSKQQHISWKKFNKSKDFMYTKSF